MANEANIKRLSEIQEQIKALTLEGMKIADEEAVKFELGDAPFAQNYGSGGLEYYPNNDEFVDEWGEGHGSTMWGDSTKGQWMSSNSWGC